MRRIYTAFYALTAIAVVAAAGISVALNRPAGPATAALFLTSAIVGTIAVALAGRILFALAHPRTDRVPVDRRH